MENALTLLSKVQNCMRGCKKVIYYKCSNTIGDELSHKINKKFSRHKIETFLIL